jgi:hypothetical protein
MNTRSSDEEIEYYSIFDYPESELSQGCLSTDFSPEVLENSTPNSKKRNRKNEQQVRLLVSEFEGNPFWSKELIKELAHKTGLSESQIYKWNWDYKKKNRGMVRASFENKLVCKETMRLMRIEDDMRLCQLAYKMQFSNVTSLSPTSYLF